MKKPILTVCVITYNHSQYIRECLDTILMQQVDFTWQIVVADDNSTDGTREILQEYKAKYPDLIHLILQKKNVGPEQNWFDLLAHPRSKYMLYSEGDDYFTDSTKLQKQVDFLEANPGYALCFHPVEVTFEQKGQKDYVYPKSTEDKDFTLGELLNQNYIQTNSAMFRRQDYSKIPRGIIPGDWYLHLMHARIGRIGFLPDVMSVYRRHVGGAWWGAVDKEGAFWDKYAVGHLKLYQAIFRLFPEKEYDAIINKSLARTMNIFIDLRDSNPEILRIIIADFPDLLTKYVSYQSTILKNHDKDTKEREKRIEELYGALDAHREHIEGLEKQLNLILNSRSWKVINTLKSLIKR